MALTDEGKKQLRWCADRALLEYDHGSVQNAVSSVLSDFTKSELTASIDPLLTMVIVSDAAAKGREALEKAIMGFNI